MSYLFLVIAMGLIAAVTKIKYTSDVYEYLFLGLINLIIIAIAYVFDTAILFKKEVVKTITYGNLDLIKKEKQSELMEDIKNRTGILVQSISIGKIDFSKDSVQIKIYYYEE